MWVEIGVSLVAFVTPAGLTSRANGVGAGSDLRRTIVRIAAVRIAFSTRDAFRRKSRLINPMAARLGIPWTV